MNVGMMWFDNDPKKELRIKIESAAAYFKKKYGRVPDLCLINPAMMPAGVIDSGNIRVKSFKSILPDHLWIGVDDYSQVMDK